MTSVFTELKRRNVFRVAIAYLVVGWVVLQAAEILSPILQLPEWTVSIVFYFGVIGFPFALVFAWAFELTPEGLKLTTDVHPDESITTDTGRALNKSIISLMAVAIILLLAERFYSGLGEAGDAGTVATETAQNMAAAEAQEPEADGPKSIAVLPFDNMSSDPDQEYFSDGISEELLNGLAKIKELQVAARTSSFAFKGDNQDIRNIGNKLNVDTVLEGSVRKAGNRVRITAQLINVEDGYHLWSETYDRELNDIFAIQDEISAAIVEALKVHLMDGETIAAHKAVDLDAYNFYLQGQHNFRRRTEKSLQLASKQYQKAIDIDPNYGDAWAGLAASTELLSEFHYGTQPVEPTRRKAQGYLDRAFAIDPNLPRAHAIQALLDLNHGEPQAALDSVKKAIAANPTEGILYSWKSSMLNELGRHDEADRAQERAFKVDPLHQTILHNVAITYAFRGQSAKARELVTPDSALAYEVEFAIAAGEGRWGDTLPNLQRSIELAESGKDNRLSFTLAAMMYFRLHEQDGAREHATPMMSVFFDTFERPEQALAMLQQVPADSRGRALEDAIVNSMLMLDRCDDVLEVYSERGYNDPDVPVWGDVTDPGGSNFTSASIYAWCLQQVGRDSEASALAERLMTFIDYSVDHGAQNFYYHAQATVQSLLGQDDDAIGSLKLALQEQSLSWVNLEWPLYQRLFSRADYQEIRTALYDHINSERAKLGWDPVEVAALDAP